MEKLNDNSKKMIASVIMLVLGILFCCSLAIGITGLSVIIGTALILAGAILLVGQILNKSSLIQANGIIGSSILAFGIVVISYKLAGIIFTYIPWLLIVFGVVLVLDAILKKVANAENTATFVVKLVIGVLAFVLGLCLILIDGFMEYAAIMLGIIMISYAIYILIANKNN